MTTKQVKKSSVKASSSQSQKLMIPLSEEDLKQVNGGIRPGPPPPVDTLDDDRC